MVHEQYIDLTSSLMLALIIMFIGFMSVVIADYHDRKPKTSKVFNRVTKR